MPLPWALEAPNAENPTGHCMEKRSGVSYRLTGKSKRKFRLKELRQSLRLQRTFGHSKHARLWGSGTIWSWWNT